VAEDNEMIDNKPPKPKMQQAQSLTEVSERDTFQTPNYATDIIVPFLQTMRANRIWECAAGLRKIVNRLEYYGFSCVATDLSYEDSLNFLDGEFIPFHVDAIVTNPPFSIKRKFFEKCVYYSKPFALLIPADYSGWTIDAVKTWGCEKIIPTRRIDYITPNTLRRIWEGEVWELYVYKKSETLKEFKERNIVGWNQMLNEHIDHCNYESIYDAPAELLRKYSSSYYHSMWLTWGFNIGRTEAFVELSNEDKFNI
jgi:hypothetical protein